MKVEVLDLNMLAVINNNEREPFRNQQKRVKSDDDQNWSWWCSRQIWTSGKVKVWMWKRRQYGERKTYLNLTQKCPDLMGNLNKQVSQMEKLDKENGERRGHTMIDECEVLLAEDRFGVKVAMSSKISFCCHQGLGSWKGRECITSKWRWRCQGTSSPFRKKTPDNKFWTQRCKEH